MLHDVTRWRSFASISLLILILNTVLFFALSTTPIESKSLHLFASRFAVKPDTFQELPPQYNDKIANASRFASENDGIVIPEALEEWAKAELAGDTSKEMVAKTGEDEYYLLRLRIISQYQLNTLAVDFTWLSFVMTLGCAIVFTVLLIAEKPMQS